MTAIPDSGGITGGRAHGTRARYVAGPDAGGRPGRGCRCGACTAANRAQHRRRSRMIAYGQWQPYVDAEPARQHVQALRAAGLGRRRIAQLAGVPASAVAGLLYGQPGRPPARRLRPGTAARLLAVQPGPTARAAGTPVDAAGTQRRLQALVALGHPQATLARRLGMTRSNFGAMMRRPQVTAATARAATRLYGQLWDTPPPVGTPRARAIAAQARAHAAARGWPPPLAWDDDTIDNPAAEPLPYARRRVRRSGDALAADAAELLRQGLSRTDTAERLGVTRAALNAAYARHTAKETRHDVA